MYVCLLAYLQKTTCQRGCQSVGGNTDGRSFSALAPLLSALPAADYHPSAVTIAVDNGGEQGVAHGEAKSAILDGLVGNANNGTEMVKQRFRKLLSSYTPPLHFRTCTFYLLCM